MGLVDGPRAQLAQFLRTISAQDGGSRSDPIKRQEWGEAWVGTDHVFTMEDGRPVDPSYMTRLFARLTEGKLRNLFGTIRAQVDQVAVEQQNAAS